MNKQTCNNITWQLISNINELHEIKEQWQRLAEQSLNSTPFSSPQWLLTWYNVYWQENWELTTLAAYVDNQLVAVLPVYIQHSLQWPHL